MTAPRERHVIPAGARVLVYKPRQKTSPSPKFTLIFHAEPGLKLENKFELKKTSIRFTPMETTAPMLFYPSPTRWLGIFVALFLTFESTGLAVSASVQGNFGASGQSEPVPVPTTSAEAMKFYITGNIAWAVETVWELAIPALILLTGAAARLQTLVNRLAAGRRARTGLYWLFFAFIFGAADFPVLFARNYLRMHWFGLSSQSFASWTGDLLKSFALGLALGGVCVWVGFYLIRRFPRRWWLAAGLAWLPALFLLVFLAPMLFEPLFNRFEPLQDKKLEARVLALAKSAGLGDTQVFQVNKSKQTTALNAYVSGLSGSARIVLWDTLFPQLTQEEILSVVAHEIGHRVLGHIFKTTLLAGFLTLLGLWGCQRAAEKFVARYGPRLRLTALTEPAVIPLFVLLLLVAQLLLTPVAFAWSRHAEAEADCFAVELTRDNHAGAMVELKLGLKNLANPRPGWWYMLLRATHPSNASRIEFFNNYKPWEKGEPLRYGGLINTPR